MNLSLLLLLIIFCYRYRTYITVRLYVDCCLFNHYIYIHTYNEQYTITLCMIFCLFCSISWYHIVSQLHNNIINMRKMTLSAGDELIYFKNVPPIYLPSRPEKIKGRRMEERI